MYRVIAVLEALSADSLVTQALLTGNVVANARVKLRAFGLDRFFDFEIGAYGAIMPSATVSYRSHWKERP